MNAKKYLKYTIIIALSVVILYSCKENYTFDLDKLSTKTSLMMSLKLPVAFANLTLADLVEEKEDTILYNSDKSISIYFHKDSLFGISVADFYKLNQIKTIRDNFEIGELDLASFSIDQQITLGTFSTNITNGKQIRDLDNQHAYFPPITLQNGGSYVYSPFDDFKTARFSNGFFELTLTNGFSVALENVKIHVIDKTSGTILFDDIVIDRIPPRSASPVKVTRSLAGLRLTNNIEIKIIEVSSPGSGSNPLDATKWVDIEMDDKLLMHAALGSLKLRDGEAIISNKVIEPDTTEVSFGRITERIYKINMKKGKIKLQIRSEVATDVIVKLTFPSATINGAPITVSIPVQYTGTTPVNSEIDLTNAKFDLTKGSDPLQPYNILPVAYNIGNPGPRQYTKFSATDKVYVEATFENLEFDYVEGYLGEKSITIDAGKVDLGISAFDQIDGGLILTDPRIKMIITNSVGIPADLQLKLTGVSSKGNTVNLLKNISITPPTIAQKTKTDIIEINKSNSNVVDLIALPPKTIQYSASAIANKGGSTSQTNFVFGDSKVMVGMEMEVVSELKTDRLAISDTIAVSFGSEIDQAESATLFVQTINGFPLDANLSIILYNSKTNTNLTTIQSDLLKSGKVTSGKVNSGDETLHTAIITLDKDLLTKLQQCDNLILKATIKTAENGTIPVKLYTDNTLSVKLGVELNVKVEDQ